MKTILVVLMIVGNNTYDKETYSNSRDFKQSRLEIQTDDENVCQAWAKAINEMKNGKAVADSSWAYCK